MGLNNLNKRAADSFERLKESKGWTRRGIEAVKAGRDIDVSKIEKMLDNLPKSRVEINEKVYHISDKRDSAVVEAMDFIDSLQLPANISIALACLIAYGQKGKKEVLLDAIKYIEDEVKNG